MAFLVGCGAPSSTPDSTKESDKESINDDDIRVIRTNADLPGTCDPAGAADSTAVIIYTNVYDSLVFLNADGEVIPWLAESWDISDDGLTYTFQMHDGVEFHNGDKVTADDVVFSMDRLLAVGSGFGYLFFDCYDYAEAVNELTVSFHLKNPYSPFLSSLCFLYIVNKEEVTANLDTSKNTYGEFGDYGTSYLLSNDAGSGPYTIASYSQQDRIVCKQFENFWNGWEDQAPQQFEIIFNSNESTVRTLMANKQLEVCNMYQSHDLKKRLAEIDGVEIAGFDEGFIHYFMYNTKKQPTDDVNYRRALNHLLNIDSMVGITGDGIPSQNFSTISMPGAAAIEDFENYRSYDLEKAGEYFAKSKYANNLSEFELDLTFHNEDGINEKAALMLQQDLAKFGIKANIKLVPWLTLVDIISTAESSPNIHSICNYSTYWDAGCMLEAAFDSKMLGIFTNATWIVDEKMDGMISDALSTLDDADRYAKYKEITTYGMEQAAVAPTCDILRTSAYHADYVFWPVAELQSQGGLFKGACGYAYYFHDFKVYNDKR